MRKSDIERQLKKEIRDSAPSDFGAVMKRCSLPEEEREKELAPEFSLAAAVAGGGSETGRRRGAGKRITALLLSFILLFGCALYVLFRVLSGSAGGGLVVSGADGYFIFDINPSVELSYDEKGRVTAAEGLNDDGEVLLYGLELVGKNYDEAADILFDRCVKLGYFSADRNDNAVLVSANLSEGGRDETMTEEMKKLLSDEFVSKKIPGAVITGVEDAALQAEGAKYGIDGQKYALILSYLALGGSLSESEYASVTVRELYAGISELEKKEKEEKIAELQKRTDETERELFKALSEIIDDIVGELDDCIERVCKDQDSEESEALRRLYKRRLDALEDCAEEIEKAKTREEFKGLVTNILTELNAMAESERDEIMRQLLQTAYGQIAGVVDGIDEVFEELEKLSVSAEEINLARLEKFFDSGYGEKEIDFEKWQKEKEKEISASWYKYKEEWEDRRKHDLDD